MVDAVVSVVSFDDCAGNEGLVFEVSHPDFLVNQEMNLVARRDVMDGGTVLFIHGVNKLADDLAQVDIVRASPRSPQTLREIIGLGQIQTNRSKRALYAPPMHVNENMEPPFPKVIGQVLSLDKGDNHVFRMTGVGADQDPKGVFTIDEKTGKVYVSQELDREVISSYTDLYIVMVC
ncbi:hypothetical protein DPEC_G00215040 [Dallia pectoralis]|uniref:Uncharacterized protein n=1 Tax=Dallia pectoralis TaxID=75939 RepID=A0ACC2G1V2_DALPE|nr:hypothetical protein DPEC_G00215040 [Dallia pectoralis]